MCLLRQALFRSRRSAWLPTPLGPLLERMTVLIKRVALNVAALGALFLVAVHLGVQPGWADETQAASPSPSESTKTDVPSLSNTAMRSATGTKSGEPSLVTFSTNSTTDFLAVPSFYEGSRSAACATVVVKTSAPTRATAMRWCVRVIVMMISLR